tara:strand:+ start:43 stop:231 length:189 start_codon:yes stop_codon:yes gene_type:complete
MAKTFIASKSWLRRLAEPLCFIQKKSPHKQHIWFLPTLKPNAEKPKELFFPTLEKTQSEYLP